jgi:Lon protease-like protein
VIEEISLFPIPGSVSFPFTNVPLHIFEPRYRQMIQESIEHKRRIGVAHTLRVVKASKVQFWASNEERLNSDHEIYEAHPIFCAGFPQIHETLPDGRIILEVEMDSRYEIIETLKEDPYQVVRCKPYEDTSPVDANANELRKSLDAKLLALSGDGSDMLREKMKSILWTAQTTLQYSFAVFSLVQMPPNTAQAILEMKSPQTRMQFLLDALTR